jgi:CO/xanthine dehydrogenase Mo-binding subunit
LASAEVQEGRKIGKGFGFGFGSERKEDRKGLWLRLRFWKEGRSEVTLASAEVQKGRKIGKDFDFG